ncbi:uncharacterized protein B0H64DRAFT_203126 [Chaetomium fimeti]|uniref:Uncharacterized protein n=1 Tax=Chaetomium fimeti TaxID=1854472 RepID=A0AAE0HAD4_9PEZI|nr:hypothetical protein B0H64DRAFT_203126 [Chaetomium fimeti]
MTSRSARYNVLTSASAVGSLEYVMIAIDVLGFSQSRFPPALTDAATNGRLEVVSMLHKLGGETNPDVQTRAARALDPLIICAARVTERATIHYLLFKGATLIRHEEADFLWRSLWLGMDRRLLGDEWIFQEIEGILWHVLLHTEEVETTNPYLPRRCPRSPLDWITHGNVAQLWSFTDRSFLVHGGGVDAWNSDPSPLPRWIAWSAEEMNACLDDPEKTLAPFMTWSATGVVSKYVKAVDGNAKATQSSPDEEELPDVLCRRGLLLNRAAWSNRFPGALLTERRLSAEEMESPFLPHTLRVVADGRDGIPFENTSMFRQTIATDEGRRHMSTFPLVRALCNAFQLAGYRAEMDDDGDIWFDVDDGDPYYDAREYQPGPGEDDGAVANCPICQDPEKHGLGYILRRAEAGEKYVDEFRARRREKGEAGRL